MEQERDTSPLVRNLLVCVGYLSLTLSALVAARRRELTMLSALGWQPWHSTGLFLAQALALAIVGGIVGIGLALLAATLIGLSPPGMVLIWTLPATLGLALVSALYPLWQLWRIQPAEILRTGTTVSAGRVSQVMAHLCWGLPAEVSFAMRNLTRSRLRTLIVLGCLFCSAGLLMVTMEGTFALRQTLQGTLLGDYVLLQTAVPQLAGGVVAVL
jgi:hypothetical protein